ncbi:MAG: hypothetical protein H7246_03870 [Phycisphaerae bacterium]|nr:hypothetical protein [Saprospiraceae bacterium]
MTDTSISKIIGITDELKGIEAELTKMESWNDTVGDLMKLQFQHIKQELLRDLLVELIRSETDFKEIDESVTMLTLYLSRQSNGEALAPEVKKSLKEVKRLVAVA